MQDTVMGCAPRKRIVGEMDMAPVTVLMVEGGSVFESNSEGYRISGAVLRIGFGCVLEEMIQGRGWKVVKLCSLSSFTLGSMLIRTMESRNSMYTIHIHLSVVNTRITVRTWYLLYTMHIYLPVVSTIITVHP